MNTGDKQRGWWLLAAIGGGLALVAGFGPIAYAATHDPTPGVDGDPITSYDDSRVQRRVGEETLAYVERAQEVVTSVTVHCQPGDPQTWATEVAEIVTRGKILGRGNTGILAPRGLRCGWCHQRSILLAEILVRNGVEDARAFGVKDHTLVRFSHDGQEYSVDPDLGVAPFAVLEDPVENREVVTAAYTSEPLNYPYDPAILIDYSLSVDDYDPAIYPATYRDAVDRQDAVLVAVERGRWVMVALGVLVAGFAARKLRADQVH